MRLSVGKRLLLGFGGVLFISMLLGFVGYYGVSKISTFTSEILNTDVYISDQASTARSLVLTLRRYEKDAFLNVNDDKKREEYLEKWQKSYGKLGKSLSNIHDKFESQNKTKDHDLAEKGIAALSDYQKGFLKVYADIEQGSIKTPQDANKSLSKYKDFIRHLEESTIEISDKANEKTRQAEVTISKYVNNIVYLIFGITVLLVFAGIVISILITEAIRKPILSLKRQVGFLGEGNFVKEIKINSQDEIGELAETLEITRQSLKNLISEVNSSADSLTSSIQEIDQSIDQSSQGAQQITGSITQLAQGASEQANSANDTLDAVNIVHKNIITALETSNDSVQLSENTKEQANQGKNQSKIAVQKVEKLEKSSLETSESINQLQKFISEIGMIAEFIKTIASQTNLLALNAAIEAARAGEHGKGFAVVAEEVKKLANQSAEATDKITEMIKEIQNKSQQAVTSINKNSQEVKESVEIIKNIENALSEILQASEITSDQIKETAKLIENIESSSDKIARMMENISAITEESAASTEEISSITQEQTASLEEINASSQGLVKIADHLKQQISLFKV